MMRKYFAIVTTIFIPLVAGYFLSYAFRTVNAPLTGLLTREFSLDAAQLGFLTSCYFITATLAQLPLGLAFDRFGPGRVQGTLMLVAALGAGLFAHADGFIELAIGRSLIGLGVAGALMAGMKAIAMSVPKERVALLNGAFVAIGATGALATSLPLDWLLTLIDWRALFVGLAVASAVSAILMLVLVPHMPASAGGKISSFGLLQIVGDARFWRLAPLSALICGSAWAVQGLWAAAWLQDVAAMDRPALANALFVMACALCAGALGYGVALDRLRRHGIGPDIVFTVIALAVILAEVALAFHWPVPPYLSLICIGASGAATVVSYSIVPQFFPLAAVARANSALNVLHFGVAFVIQNLVGIILNHWTPNLARQYPADAYQIAFLVLASLQAVALLWFLWTAERTSAATAAATVRKPNFLTEHWLAASIIAAGFLLMPFATLGTGRPSGAIFRINRLVASADAASATQAAPDLKRLEEAVALRFAEHKATVAVLQAKIDAYEREASQIKPQLAVMRHLLSGLQVRHVHAISDVTAAPPSPSPSPAVAAKPETAIASIAQAVPSAAGSGTPTGTRPHAEPNCDAPASAASAPLVIGFERYQEALSASHHDALDSLLSVVARCPQLSVDIRGYSDSRGSPELNTALSLKRARLTAKYFEAHGIATERLSIDGLGAAQPLASNASPEGRARNRRVEVTVRPAL